MKNRNGLSLLVAAITGLFITIPITVHGQSSDREVLRDRIDMLVTTHEATIEGAPIAAVDLIDELYALRDYRPAWSDPKMVQQLFDQVLRSVEHGLNPDDFHARLLGARLNPRSRSNDPTFSADTEILCTDALARLAITLQFGKLDPAGLDTAWNFSREIARQDPVAYLDHVLESRTVTPALTAQGPKIPKYRWVQAALSKYRSIMASGGWPSVASGPVLEVGSSGQRVIGLRKRLRVAGDLTTPDPINPEIFNSELEAGVKQFQMRHGIDADGKVGPRTLEELNVPVESRIDQIRATLERGRWVFRDLPNDYLIVDIAGFQTFLFRGRQIIWKTRVQVGKPYHATPVFKDRIRYLEFNPTWTIPPGILRRSTLPAIRRDPNYLRDNNMTVLTTGGKVVDPSTVDWAATASGGFPYMIRQEPGPHNALGLVKFMFPNTYMVYLHDTPSKGLFARSERAFSSGCIRTENPFELAELMLADQGWDRARIDQVLASKKTTRINLTEPMTVMLLYWTADADADGTIHFRKDLYNRDAPVIEGLDTPFELTLPEGAREAIRGR
jgi:murein L,D-transpeptidase YcbB/YkuD